MNLRFTTLSFIFTLAFNTIFGQDIRVNSNRLDSTLMQLATFGKNDLGGSDRVAYSDYDVKGRAYVIDLMKKAGLEVRH